MSEINGWLSAPHRHRRPSNIQQRCIMLPYLLVAIGGAIGSVLRYGAGIAVGSVWREAFPLGTLLINIVGSLVMGLFVGLMARLLPGWQNEARLFFAVGVLGGFTTFSSFSLDAIVLVERGALLPAALYVLVSVLGGLLALWLALLLMRQGVSA
jgi:CrcB protein